MAKLNTKENIAIVKKGITADKPNCQRCSMGSACCGCPAAHKYDAETAPLKAAGILEFAEEYTQYKKNLEFIEKLTRENEEIVKFLNDNGFGAVLD